VFSGTLVISITRKWMRFAVVITGIILATAVVTFIDGYKSLVEHASVNHELTLESERSKRLEATLSSVRVGYREVMETDQSVDRVIQRYVVQEALPVRRYRKSATFYLEGNASDVQVEEGRAFLVSLPDALQDMEVIYGQGIPLLQQDKSFIEIPVVLDAEMATLWNIQIGDSLHLIPYWDDLVEKVTVHVIGTVKLPPGSSVVWQDKLGVTIGDPGGYESIPMFVSDEILFQLLPKYLPRTTFDRTWRLALDSTYVAPATLLSVGDVFDNVRQELSNDFEGIRIESVIPGLLQNIEKKLFLAGVPIVLIGVQVGIVAFIYVMAIGLMFWERQEKEFLLFTQRGAKGWALLSIPISQVCLCVVAATLLGPLISLVGLVGLHFTPMFEMVSLNEIAGFALGVNNFLLSLIVACIGFVAMMVGIFARILSQKINTRQSNRGGVGIPAIFRYNLDIGLLVVIIPVMWELLGRRSLVTLSEEGVPQIAPLAYALPIGISIVVGLLFVRVLPLFFSLAARIVGNTGNTVLYLGTISMSRSFSALRMGFLLLAASVAVLVFSLSLGEAIKTNMEERALYAAGADIRIGIGRVTYSENSFGVENYIRNNLNVTQVSPVYRGAVSDISSYLGETFTMLAIDPLSYLEVAWYRDDFFDGKGSEALNDLTVEDQKAIPMVLPANTFGLAISVTPDRVRPTMSLMVRLRDGNGVISNHSFGLLDFTETRQLKVDLFPSSALMEGAPYTLLSLYVHEESTRRSSSPGALYLDNLYAFGRDNSSRTVLSNFNDPNIWGVTTYSLDGREVDFDLGASLEDKEDRYGVLSWQKVSFFEIAGISTVSRGSPLRAWVSDSVVESTAKSVGEVFVGSVMGQTIPIEIVGGISYFPTVDTDYRGLVLVDIREFMDRWLLAAPSVHFIPNEFWATFPSGAGDLGIEAWGSENDSVRVMSVVRSDQLLNNSRLDPVVLGGWWVWIIVASFASFAFTVAGIVTVFAMQVDKLRNTFFVLKALGLSSLKAYAAMVVDITLICCMSVVIGVLLGNLLQLIIVPMINVDVDGARILPPVVTTVDWIRSGYVCLGVVGVLAPLMIVSQMWLAMFQKAQTLRLEEL